MKLAIIFFICICVLSFSTPCAGAESGSRTLGDVLFTIDIETATGDSRCMGLEFDGTSYWATGAHDFITPYLYNIKTDGTLINKYPQPATHSGTWGWRDLAWDHGFLFAGDPNVPYIQQIDPADGQVTGVQYGPFPVTPCRALGYCTLSDAFWTASFSSSLFECFRDNTYNTFPNPGITMSGLAFEESDPSHPKGWWIGMDGVGPMAMEFDPISGGFTGKSFALLGATSGACAFDMGKGAWVLAVITSGTPDQIIGYDLNVDAPGLQIDNHTIASWDGSTTHFSLDAGAPNANRFYAIFGSATGHSPGTLLPGGTTTLPINWDLFTDILFSFCLPGFMGYLDNQGCADVALVLPPCSIIDPADLTFAFALQGWDYASNHVNLLVMADHRYDDGSTEGVILNFFGGDVCRLHPFQTMGASDTISAVSVAWGSAAFPGYYPVNGTPSKVFVWEDPNDTGDPRDGVLLAYKNTVVQNVDTDILNEITLDAPVAVNGTFFVGCVINYPPLSGVLGMDADTPYGAPSWIGSNLSSIFDYQNMSNNAYTEMGGIGFPGCFLLRAIPE